MTTTIAYITNRNQPMIEWFFDSLHRELEGDYSDVKILVVDFFADQTERRELFKTFCHSPNGFTHVTPKPTPFQGSFRLTDQDYFCASTARNTALCLAPDGYIVFVDDVSVFIHGWWNAVKSHRDAGRVVAGAYRKVMQLQVDKAANLTYWLDNPAGRDCRLRSGITQAVPCTGQSFFGCSFGIPVETMLSINGFDEALDGIGFEDVCFGLRLDKIKPDMVYDPTMMTFESEELHRQTKSPALTRYNRPIAGFHDCAWEMLDWIRNQGSNPRSRGTLDLREIRDRVLSGQEFPPHGGFFIWPDGKNLLGQ